MKLFRTLGSRVSTGRKALTMERAGRLSAGLLVAMLLLEGGEVQAHTVTRFFDVQMMLAAEIFKGVMGILKPQLERARPPEALGKVVLATPKGDIHDLGLNIVGLMLDINGFHVHNLGKDVPAARFVTAIHEAGATVVGMSGLLTLAFDAMKRTVEAIEAAGLRDQVKIMVGGSQIDEQIREYVGADSYGEDAMAAVRLCQAWTMET